HVRPTGSPRGSRHSAQPGRSTSPPAAGAHRPRPAWPLPSAPLLPQPPAEDTSEAGDDGAGALDYPAAALQRVHAVLQRPHVVDQAAAVAVVADERLANGADVRLHTRKSILHPPASSRQAKPRGL